jgi:iron complex outermembrane receptor protein
MYIRYTRAASAVLCILTTETAVGADPIPNVTDTLDTIEVQGETIMPSETIVDTQQLSPGRDTGDTLRYLLGVSGSRMGGHGIDPTIRGLRQTQINVLLDGAYVHGGCPNRMDPPTSYAPVGGYEEITVIRGSKTLEYGGGGPGGTILFDRVTERFDAEEKVRGRFGAGYRGYSDTQEYSADVAGGNESLFGRFIGSYTDAQNYEDGNGDEVRSSFTQPSGTVILGYTPSDATRAEVSYDKQKTLDALFPGAGMDSPESDNETVRLKFDTRDRGGFFARVKAEFYSSEVDHVMDNYTFRLNLGMKMRAPSTSDTIGGRLVTEIDSLVGLWKVGVNVQNNDRDAKRFNDTGPQPLLNSVLWPGVEIDQTGVFAELTHDLNERNRVIGGLRYDRVESNASKADLDPPGMLLSPNQLYAIYYDGAQAKKDTDHNVGGLLRFEHDLTNGAGTLYAGITRSVRTPDATERFIASNSMTPSDRWVGNPYLNPEKHHQIELGVMMRGERWDAEGSLYYNAVSDYILRDRFTAGGNNATIYRNIDATLIGGEASVSYRFSYNWRTELGVAYVWAENDTDDRPIAQTPPLEGSASIEYSQDKLIAGASVRAATKQTRVDLDSSTGIPGQGLDVQKTPGWGVLDLYTTYEVNGSITLDIGVDNVFDKAYAQHLNRSNAFDPTQVQVNEPGRAAWIKFSAEF